MDSSNPKAICKHQAGIPRRRPIARRYHKDRSCKELTRTNIRMSVADTRKQGMLSCPTCRPAR